MGSKKRAGAKTKELTKPKKKKVSILTQEHIEYVDWKDVNLLRKFMSERAKIRARRVTGNDAQQQKEVSRAIKNAREMALLPYTNRITTQRGSKSRARDQEDRPDHEVEGDAETATEYEDYSEEQAVELASEEVEV